MTTENQGFDLSALGAPVDAPIPAPAPAAAAADEPKGYFYRVVFASGASEFGFSRLDPRAFAAKVRTEKARKGWVDWDDGDGFEAARVDSVKVVPAEAAQ